MNENLKKLNDLFTDESPAWVEKKNNIGNIAFGCAYTPELISEITNLINRSQAIKIETVRNVTIDEPVSQQTIITIYGLALTKP